MDIDRSAPVIVEKSLDIDAGPEEVWDVLVDVEGWPAWNPTVSSAALDETFAQGSTFKWKSGASTIRSTIERADRPHLAGWKGSAPGAQAIHVWRLEPIAEGTRVTTQESMSGFIPKLFRGRMQRMLETSLDTWLTAMSGAVERRRRSRAGR